MLKQSSPHAAAPAPAGQPEGKPTLPGRARLDIHREGDLVRIILGGDWKLDQAAEARDHSDLDPLPNEVRRLFRRQQAVVQRDLVEAAILDGATRRVALVAEDLGHWDSSLLAVVVKARRLAETRQLPLDDSALPEGVRNLVRLALTVPPSDGARHQEKEESCLAVLGGAVLAVPRTLGDILDFVGDVVLSLGRFFRGKSACTSANFWLSMQEAGVDALPIVSLISLLVGLILAFVGVIQLSMFGAEIYVSSLVAVGMTRIMGAIMTGIILAGRTGASYAAVIGTMQVNEEIDALNTLGVSPTDYLVLPRLLSLTLMTPLLVLYGDVMGILGGFLVGTAVLGLDPMEYYTFTRKGFVLSNLWVGLAHGAVFGMVIAITGCYQGLRCGRSAEAVGKATTSAVVFSIVGIVLSTSILTILFNILKI